MPGAQLIQPVPGYAWRAPGTPFTSYHAAVDVPAPTATPVVAVCDGRIAGAGWELPGLWGGGNVIRLAAETRGANMADARGRNTWIGRSVEFAYCHLQGFAPGIKAGVDVHAGQTIGYVDTTADLEHLRTLGLPSPTGPHLHFMCKVGGIAYDYRRFVAGGDLSTVLFGYPGGKEPAGVATQGTATVHGIGKVTTVGKNADGTCPTGYISGSDLKQVFSDQGPLGWLLVNSPVGLGPLGGQVQIDDGLCYNRSEYSQAAFDAAAATPFGGGWGGLLDTLGGIARNGIILLGAIALLIIGAWALLRGGRGGSPPIAVG